MARTSNKKKAEEVQIINIFGWKNAEEVATDIWNSSADILLRGDLVFAFKDSGSDIEKLVVVNNFEIKPDGSKVWLNNFGVYMATKTWSCVIPHVTSGYLEEIVLSDLTDHKIDKNVINNYKLILENLMKNGN